MVYISSETWNKAGVSAISIQENDDVNKNLLLFLSISEAGKRYGCPNIYDLIDKKIMGKYVGKKTSELTKPQIRKYKIDRARLIKGSKLSMYVSDVILIPIVVQARLSKPETIKSRSDLGFNQINLILKKNNQ